MGKRDKDLEKEFSLYLDRLLAGEEISPGDEMNEEIRTALEFAGKLISLGEEPSPSFREELKKKLLREIVEQDVRNEVSRPKGGFWQSMVWRTVFTAAIVVFIGVVGFFWYMSGFFGVGEPAPVPEPSAPAPATEPSVFTSLEVSMVPDKADYSPGQPVAAEISFKNTGVETFQIAPFPPELILVSSADDGNIIRRFPEGIVKMYLDPEEVTVYDFTWDQRDENGLQVPPGRYYLKADTVITTLEGTEMRSIPVSGILIH